MCFWPYLNILSIKMTIFCALCAHLLRNYTQYLTVSSCFRRVFCEMFHFYTSYSYNVIHFRIDVHDGEPRDVMMLAEGVNISISTHNLCPHPYRRPWLSVAILIITFIYLIMMHYLILYRSDCVSGTDWYCEIRQCSGSRNSLVFYVVIW